MIYKGYSIGAIVPNWEQYELNEDGTLGDFIDSSGACDDQVEYEVWQRDQHSDSDFDATLVADGFKTIVEAEFCIEQLVAEQTVFTPGISV